ncbi:reverse transcriptase domain-containing protein [Tanacetum coccineum]
MSTYLKNMARYKHNHLKNKSFNDIHKLFNKAMKRVNTFVDMDTELVEGSKVRAEAEIASKSSSKRVGTKLEQESIKKQNLDEDKETAELQRLIEVVPDKEEVAIDAIPLATKRPSVVDYKIRKEGKKTYYYIIRADGSSKMYLVFSHMLKIFNREDLETLWKLSSVKDEILVAQGEASKDKVMDETHASRYSVHSGADKTYYDLRDINWWPCMKKDIATYVSNYLTCSKVKAEISKTFGLLQQPEILEWKWDNITMDFITKLPSIEKLARLYIDEIIARNVVSVSIILDRDGWFTSCF